MSDPLATDEVATADRVTTNELLAKILEAVSRPRLEDRLALDAAETAAAIGVSERTLWTMVSAERFPAPIYLSDRCPVWPVDVIKKWLVEKAAKAKPRTRKAQAHTDKIDNAA